MTQGDEEIDAPPKPTTGISWHANGDANSYHLLHGDRWIAHILMNGELTVSQQEDMLERIVVALDGGLKLACRTACGSGNAVTALPMINA